MAAYDLRQLSSRDFEELTRDLLQAEWDVTLERFKVGPDQGVDLRCGKTIIQCKHYARSDYATLLSKLRRDELPKVRKLNPDRYVLVTSLELSPANKDVIADLFRPYVLSPGDVKGAGDIESLLQRHPEVGRANFKLWLTNTEVLERVLHNAEECQTSFAIERVIRKLPVFVQNAAFPRAQKILDETRVLVISGVPGIGKTTLAEMLLYAHLEQGYQPVVIHSDVREGKNRFSSLRPQVFYFDDFLGQTFLGENRLTGRVNGDLELVEFVEMIKASGKSRFILTTREHLLQNARGHSERLAHSALVDSRCLLELGDYSRGQRGRILYNHLYFSDLARDYKEQILRDDFFLEILEHKHFNPRLIEWLSSASRLRNVPSASYQGQVRDLLANPQAIWSHAFNRQLSSTARNALLTLYSLGGTSERSEFEWLWKAFDEHCAARYHRASEPTSYRNALKDLDNAFVSYPREQVTFLNPSVGEMIASEIADCPEYALDLVVAAGRFRQIIHVFKLAKQEGYASIHSALGNNPIGLMNSVTRLLRSADIK